jgi:hypothetical protein
VQGGGRGRHLQRKWEEGTFFSENFGRRGRTKQRKNTRGKISDELDEI